MTEYKKVKDGQEKIKNILNEAISQEYKRKPINQLGTLMHKRRNELKWTEADLVEHAKAFNPEITEEDVFDIEIGNSGVPMEKYGAALQAMDLEILLPIFKGDLTEEQKKIMQG